VIDFGAAKEKVIKDLEKN
jgi:hypothetical protein